MNKSTKTPFIINLLGWLISLFAFSLGFWHTHLGLREFRALSSSNGSIIIAAIILFLLIVAYYRAIRGMKLALLFYGLCAMFFFTFNMNSFYPTYLGRKLIKEEAIVIKDKMDNFKSRVNKEFGKEEVNKSFDRIIVLRKYLTQEIAEQDGFGPRATSYLNQLNSLMGQPYLLPNIVRGNDSAARVRIAESYDKLIGERIKSYMAENIGTGQSQVLYDINDLSEKNSPELEKIITDNSKVNIDSIRSNKQVLKMQEVVTRMDKICTDANKLVNLNNDSITTRICTNYGEVKSQNIGTFAHTISSVWERLNKIDTWGIIILVLFIDFIVPLAIYFLIRRRDDEEEDQAGGYSWFDKILNTGKPQKF